MKMDIVVWDRGDDTFASPVSAKGSLALNAYIQTIIEIPLPIEKFVGCCHITIEPVEFLAHLPADISVIFYDYNTDLVHPVSKKSLQ